MKGKYMRYGQIFFGTMILSSLFLAGAVHSASSETVIKVVAKKFSFSPSEIVVKKGVPVRLELTSVDVAHGFNCPELGIGAQARPFKTDTVNFVAHKAGSYDCYCDTYCGEGHDDMKAKIIVQE
jgi:cytochrome c oxidase subunit 2